MAKSTQELIGEIRSLSANRLDGRRREEMLEELRSHLEEAVRARLELGQSIKEAEEEVVLSFGDPKEFVLRMQEQHPAERRHWFDRDVLLALLCTTLFLTVTYALASNSAGWSMPYPVFLLGVVLLAIWIVLTSWRTQRSQVLPLISNWLVAIPLFAIAWSFGDLPDRGFNLEIGPPRAIAERQLGELDRKMRSLPQIQSDFNAAANKYFYHRAPNSKPMEPYWGKNPSGVGFSYRITGAASEAEARRRWADAIELFNRDIATQRFLLDRDKVNLQERLDRPFWVNALYQFPTGAFFATGWGGIMALLSLGAWFLRELWTAIKSRRRPRRGIAI